MSTPAPHQTVALLAARWLARQEGRVARATLVQYRNAVELWIIPSLGTVSIEAVTRPLLRDAVASWLPRLGLETVRTRLVPLRGLLEDAVDDGLLVANPAHDLARKVLGRQRETNPAEKAMGEVEVRRFFAVAPDVHAAFADYWLLLHRGGVRPGEGLALEWRNVFEPEGKARIAHTYSQGEYGDTKSRRMRWVDLSEDLVAALTRRRTETPGRWVFPSSRVPGKPWSYTYMLELFDRICERAGLLADFTPHCFRHGWATWLSEEPGVPTKYIQRALGHGSLAVTDRYTRGAKPPHLGYVNALDRRVRRPALGLAPHHGVLRVG